MTWGLRGARRRKGAISDMGGISYFLSRLFISTTYRLAYMMTDDISPCGCLAADTQEAIPWYNAARPSESRPWNWGYNSVKRVYITRF